MSDQKKMNDVILVSGGFDPVHVGHIRMFRSAARLGSLVIGLNSDEWLVRKKGFVFMPFEERKEVLEAIKGVWRVEGFDDSDETCIDFLRRWKKHMDEAAGWSDVRFCNGGDRKIGTTPEVAYCENNGIDLIWGVGGDEKVQSSSNLVCRSRIPGNVDPNNPDDWERCPPQGAD